MNELTEKQKGEFFELPVEMGIFVPSTKNASVPVSESEFESRVRQVEDFVAKLFGGFSSFDDIQGGYYSDDLKEVIREDVKEVRFFANAGAFQENIKGLLNQITLWCLEWGQEAIGFEIEGDLFYVGANSKIYRYGGETYANGGVTLSHVDVSMAPMGERTQVGSEGDTYLGQNAFLYKNGGQVDYSREMIKSQNKEIAHHSSELSAILDKYKKMKVEPWVIGKLERASTDLSDVTHYFDGKEGEDYYAKGGVIVTSIKDIPNFEQELNYGKIKYRGLGMGKVSDDFYKLAGEGGKRIKVGGKEYYITDTEFDTFSRDSSGKLRVKFDAPVRKFAKGGEIKDQYEGRTPEDIWNNLSISQRQHFIYDHVTEIEDLKGLESLPTNEIRKASKSDWDNLDKDIKNRFSNHTREGQYAKGGEIPTPIMNLINDMIERKVQVRFIKISDKSKREMFLNDSKNAIKEGYLKIKQDPTDDSMIIVSLGLKSSKKIEFAKGGDIPVKIVNKGKTYNKSNYKAIYGDFDKDGLINSDDPNPIKKGDKRRVEQLSFPKIFDNLLDTKDKLDSTMYDAVDTLKKITPDGGKIYARTKTPYSIINKLIDSRMIVSKDPKKGLTDMVGTTIVVDNVDDVMQVQKEIESGALGEIVPEGYDKNGNVILADDKYKNPKGGYRAIHYIIMMDGIPVEVQLKTKRMKEINELAHPHYKAKNLNSDYMNYLTDLADKGDRGDVKAQREFNSIMRNKKNVSEKLKLDSTYMYATGGRVQEIYGDEMDLDGIFEDFKED